MKYIVYLTINLKSTINGNNKIYIGYHRTEDPYIFDGYLGDGCWAQRPSSYMYPKTPFQCAVKKYGPAAFRRTTLYVFDTLEEASYKEGELITPDFIQQDHVYNVICGGSNSYKLFIRKEFPLYQFDLQGVLKKEWHTTSEVLHFYGVSAEKLKTAIYEKHPFLRSLWSRTKEINPQEYTDTKLGSPKSVYIYNKSGMLYKEFNSIKDAATEFDTSPTNMSRYIKTEALFQNKYYISESLRECFIPKKRKQYSTKTFYLYSINGEYIGEYYGKNIMSQINMHSWRDFSRIMEIQNGWYKNWYISLEKVDTLDYSTKLKTISVDVYTKYGEFIETLHSVKEVREKYKVSSAQIKNIQYGNKYVGDYIFKYSKK